jgi:hypothetical protein
MTMLESSSMSHCSSMFRRPKVFSTAVGSRIATAAPPPPDIIVGRVVQQ